MSAFHLASGQTPFDLIPLGLALLVLPLVSVLAGRQIGQKPPKSLVPRYLQTMLRGWLMVALVAGLWWRAGRPVAALGLDIPIRPYGIYGLVIVGIAALGVAFQLFNLRKLVKSERLAKLRKQLEHIKILPRSNAELIVFILVSLTAGIWEELIYRGFLFWFFAPHVSLPGIVILSSLVFAVGHAYQGWRGVMFSGSLGVLFGLLFAASGSLWWLMAAHALVDLNGGLVAWRVTRMSR